MAERAGKAEGSGTATIIVRVLSSPLDVDGTAWNALLARQSQPTPFMRHEYLAALHTSGSAVPASGWTPCFITLWESAGQSGGQCGGQNDEQHQTLIAACPLYLKTHSFGEYVFDQAWANAYAEHGLAYYPKAVIAVPFTPAPGARLLARDAAARALLLQAALRWCGAHGIASLHLLFGAADDLSACAQQGLMLRQTLQFHWQNRGWRGFEDFLASLNQEKRKKIRQERRRVAEAGVRFRALRGAEISGADWDFFYRCYQRTYLEHGNPPYLSRDFFARTAADMPEAWLLFVAERAGQPIASSLIAIGSDAAPDAQHTQQAPLVAYGRYWGALERVDCLHFEACYYQPLQWCMERGASRFEGGAQGEHKMARALLPTPAGSAHWLAHPGFAGAVQRYLEREGAGVDGYLAHLQGRSPFKDC